MKESKIYFSQEVYLKQPKINNILLTRREIDIVACLLYSLKTKKIADILSIGPRTVEKHISNIFTKFECNSREGIIDSLEKSEHILNLRKHCTNLINNFEFEKCLKGVSKKSLPENLKCTLSYDKDHKPEKGLIKQIVRHLELLKIQVNHCKWEHTLKINEEKVIFLCLNNGDQIPEEVEYIDFISGKNYYPLFFDLLQKLHSPILSDKSISEFKKKFRATQSQHASEKVTESFVKKVRAFVWEKKSQLAPALLFLCMGTVGLFSWKEFVPSQKTQIDSSIRSDLNTPTESVLLQRPEIIAEIDTKLNKMDGIQTVALVGSGGSGKTILARQYAQSQKFPIVWEINAETKESTASSFEKLADKLAQSEQEKQTLKEFQEIKDVSKKQESILHFVKEHLKKDNHWLLIFDNVESLSELQDHIPHTTDTWGQGIVILTTRNSNVQSNKYVSSVIRIGELTPHQKLTLFSKIMTSKNSQPLSLSQREDAITFLRNIPPFPLDISVAAYYLKATNSSYADYIEKMSQSNKDFEEIQKEILKESGDYNKTRYSIITLSLRHLMNSNKDFGDLLLFISLLDSQDIPRDLLNSYKNNIVVENFIYNLKKYSLIMEEPLSSLQSSTLSIHRSTQTISLAYLVKTLNLNMNMNFIEHIGTTLKNYAAEAIDKEDFSKMNLLIRHCEVFLSHTNLLTKLVIASISDELGHAYRDIGNYEKAKQLLEESLVIYRNSSHEEHFWFARALAGLGSVYRELGNYEKAKQLFEESLIIHRKNSYENHPWFARALGTLGNVYKDLNNYEKAQLLLEESILIYRKNSYESHPWFARALGSLGNVYKELGNYEKAKQLLEESLIIYRKNSYENHPWFARALGRLGSIYARLENNDKAKQLLEESILIYKKNFFENHSWFALTLAELGNVYSDLGDYEKAKDLLEQSIQIYEKIYGRDHINTTPVIMNLGEVYLLEGHLDTAEKHFNKALEIFQLKNHPDSYSCLENLSAIAQNKSIHASVHGDKEKSKIYKAQAVDYINKALKIAQDHFPKNSPHIIRIESKIRKIEKN